MDRPTIRVLCLRLNWVTLAEQGPMAAMRGDHEFKEVDLLEVPYYLSRGWLALCEDPEDLHAFAQWRAAHPEVGE